MLEPGSNFHFLPIEPAEGFEALSFKPNGEMFFYAGMMIFAKAKYALSEPQTLIVTRGGDINTYTLIVATNQISILSESKKAIYRRVQAPD